MLSAWARMERLMLRALVRPILARGSYLDWRRRLPALPPPFGVRVVPALVGGVRGEWLVPEDAGDTVIYYLHGGGFVIGDPPLYRRMVGRLAQAAGARALVIDYRLAPENPFPAAIEDCVAGYRALVARGISPDDIVVAGDSAGGTLALATLVCLRDAGDALPAGAALVSPLTDLTVSGDSMSTCVAEEVLLAPEFCRLVAGLYLGDADPRSPLASPLFADLRGLPPLEVHVGTHELLLDDARRLAVAARAVGVDVTLAEWADLWHVFPMLATSPEARLAIGELATFVRAHSSAAAAEAAFDGETEDVLWAPERA